MRKLTCALVVLALVALSPALAAAQDTGADEKAVRELVVRLFDGMRARDTVMMKSTLADNVVMFGLDRQGNVRADGAAGWLQSVGRDPQGPKLDEVLHDVEVRIDGPLAAVWTYYDLFAGDDFVHCGYDAFTLLKTPQAGWKIVAVADSRRREGCRQKRTTPPTGR